MATIKTSKKPLKDTIDKFYGLNLTGETQLSKGESPNMTNCYITDSYDLDKMYGYKQMMKSVSAIKKVRGIWQGLINGVSYFLFACNGHIYRVDNDYWDNDEVWESTLEFTDHCDDLGTLTDAETRFFAFDGKVYIINGTEYKVYDGTSLTDVAGYIPKIRISCTPSTGSGTEFEGLNLLTGKKHQTYNGDGTATYQLAETSVGSVDSVYVGGVLKTVTTHYTVNTTTGVVTFTAGNLPPTGLDNVDIYWTKGTGNRDSVLKNRAISEFKNRIFMYGNPSNQNILIWSELENGKPSAEYFPALSFQPVGNSSTTITDITNGYDRMIITKPNSAYSCIYDVTNLDGLDVVNFPISDLNDTTGNIAFAQGQVIDNYPVTIEKGIQQWVRTDIKDEKNAQNISRRIQKELNTLDLSTALTLDYQEKREYWLVLGMNLYIYNYGLYGIEDGLTVKGVYSRIILKDTPTCLEKINGEIYFGTDTGKIMKFNTSFLTFNGETINAHWESGFNDYGANYLTKSLNKVWTGLQPQLKSKAEINFITDIKSGDKAVAVTHQRQVFALGEVDFSDFSFAISANPQPKLVKLKAKQFTYLKIVIENNSADETCKILNLTTNINYGGESK